jgi:hypothetical protein
MRRIGLIFCFSLLLSLNGFAAFIPADRLQETAISMSKAWIGEESADATVTFTESAGSHILMRAFSFSGGGFVLLAGSDAVYPLLAYSHDGQFSGEMSPALLEWLAMYREQILLAEELSSEGLLGIHPAWIQWLDGAGIANGPENTSARPLLSSNWNQGKYYNALCPADTAGPGGRVYAGCVATAMGMAMHYYKYPSQGQGAHSYYANNYGLLNVNFSNEHYDWYASENSSDNHYNDEIARILYHCGVGVEMMYSPSGSGAFMDDARDALVNYFGYSVNTALVYKTSYSDAGWKTMLKQQLDLGIPLIYAGYPSGGGSGHAFVLDGYQGTDHFHFNWGWSAAYNGYFYLNAMTPGGNSFSSGQQAIVNLVPGSGYPQHCTGQQTITHSRGMLFDGSGPASHAANADCIWTINPGNVEKFVLYLDMFNPGDSGDSLIIYAGTDVLSPVLLSFNTDTSVQNLVLAEDVITIRFKSNSSVHGDGFELSFQAILSDYCKGTTNIVAGSGLLSDGSGVDDYRNGSLCKWNIESGNGMALGLTFTMMDIAQGDFVRVYDVGSQPGTILGQFSGANLPSMLVSASGKMLLLFYTDQQVSADGWEANWISGANLAISNVETPEPFIFPNPASSHFFIRNAPVEQSGFVRVMNLQGQDLVLPVIKDDSEMRIDISSLPSGLYLVDPGNAQGNRLLKLQVIK